MLICIHAMCFGRMGIYNRKGTCPLVESPLCLMLVREVYA